MSERKKGYHSDDTDEEQDDGEMLLEGRDEENQVPVAGSSNVPSQSTSSNQNKVIGALPATVDAAAGPPGTSAVGSGLKGGIVPVVVKRNKKLVERVRSFVSTA